MVLTDPATPAAPAALQARSLALLGYGLVIASFFTFWITGIAAWLLAFFNRKTPDLLARSHFRNQLRIADLYGLLAAAGIGVVVWGGWTAIGPWFASGEFSWGRLFGAGAWVLLGLTIWAIGTLTAIVFSAVGAVQLLRGELVGRERAQNLVEARRRLH